MERMDRTKDYFPVDIYAVKEYGLEKLSENFFWPVSDADFVKLYNDIEQLYKDCINSDEETGKILLIQFKLFHEYLQFLHALKAIIEARKRGKEPLYTDKSFWYRDIIRNDMARSHVVSKIKNPGLAGCLRGMIVKSIKAAEHNSLITNLFKKPAAVVYGPITSIMAEYIKESKYTVRFMLPSDLFPFNFSYKISEGLHKKIKDIACSMVTGLQSIAGQNGFTVDSKHADHLLQMTESALQDAAKVLYAARKKIGVYKPENMHLLISSCGNVASRAVATAAKEKGFKVTGFTHGGSVGIYDNPTLPFLDFAFSDEFVTYTKESMVLFQKINEKHPFLKNDRIKINSCNDTQFMKLEEKYKNEPLSKSIKTVMLLGYPHNQLRKPHASAGLSLMHLDLEFRLINVIRDAGYDVLYKVHPDRVQEVNDVFRDKVKVVNGYFQNYLHMADAFLFGSIRTTAFSRALCTNKPIIGFIMKDEAFKPFPEALDLLQKRCTLIKTEFDSSNRIIFDRQELINALRQRPEQPNTEFIEKYMFPEKEPDSNTGKRRQWQI